MAPEELCDILKERFGEAITDTVLGARRPYAVVAADRWFEVARFLRDDERMRFNMLQCISAVDLLEDNKLAAVYELFSIPVSGPGPCAVLRHHFAVRVEVDRDDPHIPSVSHVWPAGDWHEREAFDMMGIVFDGHPNLTRILCPDDWKGHPLRKDYEFPVEYHGIPATTEHQLTNPRH
ncbi:MAG: NADH-quinone oxidoreductase subunit C [Phycisphaerae bacterium]